MRTPRTTLGRRPRGLLLALIALAQAVAATGLPLPAPAGRPGGAFPCQSRGCGCLTAELCWAGDCCCSTLEDKLLWADARGVEPPPHVRPLVAARRCVKTVTKKCQRCAAAAEPGDAGVTLVVAESARKCRGQSAAGAAVTDPAVLPAAPALPPPAGGVVEPAARRDDAATSVRRLPPTPPPRLG